MPTLRNTFHLIILALAGQSIAAVLPEKGIEIFERSSISPRDTFDVTTYASLGESFATGPSAGDKYDDTKCRRYKQAFGPLVAADSRIKGPKPIEFMFVACSGSKLKNIYEDSPNADNKPKISQAEQLKDKNPDMVTMSIGGNDVGFVKLLDKCVYRLQQSTIDACRGCGWFWFDDCTNDCNAQIQDINNEITQGTFATAFNEALRHIFQYAPKTKLFITGYPAFWNEKTDYCDNVSFKLYCPNNWVLPLIKDRRAKMNALTAALNARIQTLINNYPTGADIHYVDVNPYFEGHRFCEEGVQEPSYRNPNIWFYPLEYTTGGTVVTFDGKEVPSGDCNAMFDNFGDQGDYFACLMANGVLANGTSIDLNNTTNNVAGDGEVAIKSGGEYPDWLARVFHPTINGMGGYQEAIIKAYEDYTPRQTTFQAGTCHVNVNQTQLLYSLTEISYGWQGSISDNSNADIDGCSTGYEVHESTDDYSINCDTLKNKVTIDANAANLKFTFADQTWTSDDTNACTGQDWLQPTENPMRSLSCQFKC